MKAALIGVKLPQNRARVSQFGDRVGWSANGGVGPAQHKGDDTPGIVALGGENVSLKRPGSKEP